MSNGTHFVQYFNIEKMGRFPNGADALSTTRMGVYSKLAAVQQAKGGTVYVISGFGKPKTYVLWEAFTIEDIVKQDDQFVVSGPGRVLLPPAVLSGADFEKFKSACANFIGFRKIDDQKYTDTLKHLADANTKAQLAPACEQFCDELVKAFPKMGDAYYYRAHTRQHLGNSAGAKTDYEQAIKLGTNFPDEARAGAAGPPPETQGGNKKQEPEKSAGGIAAQVVAKGVFAGKPPTGVSEVAWRGVLQRRGAEDFRQKVLSAYGSKCAVTSADAEAVIEVALIDPEGPNELKNAIPLRADLRTLFDLNLLRVHPKTRKVFLADSVQNGSYARLWARTLRAPTSKDAAPDFAALQKRWNSAK
ncbi:hypothetical protein J8F10_26030 [Gemmata sp. G18]|uniref:Tetratricopeptide repeat protein n=1 Tax=Gemmata palustris TaxID=2822762 RepID=A0ABS5BYA0_9BACT|nr:HNH endonuclease [Gemmata palustris]MBP3958719.1 hypothetical protein [Gemmata palustris]